MTPTSLEVTKDHAVPIAPPASGSSTILNAAGDTLYYADNSQVSASNNQGSLTATNSQTFSNEVWVVSASRTDVSVTYTTPGPITPSVVQVRDITTFGAKVDGRMLSGLTVSGNTVTGPAGTFVPTDAGRTFCAFLANGSGVAGQAVVQTYNSSTSVTLASSITSPPAVARVQSAATNLAGNGAATTYTVSLAGVAAGDSLILAATVTTAGVQPNLSVADNVSGVWVKLTGQTMSTGTGPTEFSLWQCIASPGGSVTVTVTSSAAGVTNDVGLWLEEFSGVGAVDQIAIGNGTGTTMTSPSITPSVAGELALICGFPSAGGPSASPSGPWTDETGATWFSGAVHSPLAWQVGPTAGSALSSSWTVTSGAWISIAVSFRSLGPVANGVIGTDDTSAWQTAINWAAAQSGSGGRVTYNAGTGTSLIAGPQQTGTVTSVNAGASGAVYSYSGQLLLPAVSLFNGALMAQVEIRGTQAPAGCLEYGASTALEYPAPTATLVLFSTATSGNVVDVIGDVNGFIFGKGVFSWIQLTLRRLAIRTAGNSSGAGPTVLNLLGCACASLDETAIDVAQHPVINSPPASPGPLSSSGTALVLPGANNWAVVNWHRSSIAGYPKGIVHTEHAILEGAINNCGAALAPGGLSSLGRTGGSHSSTYARVLCQHCNTYIEPLSGDSAFSRAVDGHLEVEGPFDCLINDPTSIVTGALTIGNAAKHMWVRNASTTLTLQSAGIPAPVPNGFTRVVDSLTTRSSGYTAAGRPQPFGVCDGSYHVWVPDAVAATPGAFIDANGAYGNPAGVNTAWKAYIPNSPPYTSKHITATVAASSTANRTFAGILCRAPSTANMLSVVVDGTASQRVSLNSGTFGQTLITSAAATITASSNYVLDVYIQSSTKPGGTVQITVLLNGAFMFTYTLTAAQQTTFPLTGWDGIGGLLGSTFDNGVSRISAFAVTPATDLPYVASGTAVLAAGTSGSIANTSITASSKVRVWNNLAGGTVGALSVALAAGVGFTINSSSGADTSTIYYEIANY